MPGIALPLVMVSALSAPLFATTLKRMMTRVLGPKPAGVTPFTGFLFAFRPGK